MRKLSFSFALAFLMLKATTAQVSSTPPYTGADHWTSDGQALNRTGVVNRLTSDAYKGDVLAEWRKKRGYVDPGTVKGMLSNPYHETGTGLSYGYGIPAGFTGHVPVYTEGNNWPFIGPNQPQPPHVNLGADAGIYLQNGQAVNTTEPLLVKGSDGGTVVNRTQHGVLLTAGSYPGNEQPGQVMTPLAPGASAPLPIPPKEWYLQPNGSPRVPELYVSVANLNPLMAPGWHHSSFSNAYGGGGGTDYGTPGFAYLFSSLYDEMNQGAGDYFLWAGFHKNEGYDPVVSGDPGYGVALYLNNELVAVMDLFLTSSTTAHMDLWAQGRFNPGVNGQGGLSAYPNCREGGQFRYELIPHEDAQSLISGKGGASVSRDYSGGASNIAPAVVPPVIPGEGGTTPTCNDGIQNGDETGVDCGGSCPACSTEPTCNDGIQNGDETGVDCGGSCPACSNEPTCNDGIQNGDETGVDCGGSCPNSCGTAGTCGEFGVSYVDNSTIRVYHRDKGWSASWQYVCLDGYCVAGEKKDGYYYKDFNATLGQQYTIQFKAQDNANGQYLSPEEKITFTTDKCSFVVNDAEPTCNDGIQNGNETGVDCGGPCPACTTEPTCNDGIQNGDETGIDCGGSCTNNCEAVSAGSCGEFGISHVNDNTVRVYHKDNGWSASWQYICLDGYCVTGEKKDGYYYKDFDATLGQQYTIQFKAQDNANGQYLSPEEKVTFTTDKCTFTGGTEPTCNDGIQNGDETGVDCGGSCPACSTEPTCNDGIQNGDETGVDCGGSCPACSTEPTCNDGIQNGDETGVDCGGSCPACSSNDYFSGKFTPSKGRLLVIGQDITSITGYNNAFDEVPAGHTGYSSVSNLEGLTSTADYGTGPHNASQLASTYPNSAIAIGLYVVDQLGGINNGSFNGNMGTLIDNLVSFNRPIYLRFGYEFDGPWNHYEPNEFKAAWIKFHDMVKQKGAQSHISMVWQSASYCSGTYNNHPIDSWYPGDQYVDMVGVSIFTPLDCDYSAVNNVVNFARNHNKPVMVCESAPQGYDLLESTVASVVGAQNKRPSSPEETWNNWFKPYFDYIENNEDIIRVVAYINADWDSQGMWDHPYDQGYWGDTRVETNSTIKSKWLTEMSNPDWIMASPSLFSDLGFPANKKNTLSLDSYIQELSLYPNPVKDVLHFGDAAHTTTYSIFTIHGMKILEGIGNSVDVSSLKDGVYMLKTDFGMNKFIKQ